MKIGGHIASFEGLWPKRWYRRPMIEFINAINEISEIIDNFDQ